MEYLAHSAHDGCPPQSYRDHIEHVTADTVRYAREVARYNKTDGDLLITVSRNGASVHDMGKLDSENQQALHNPDQTGRLPLHHADAGVACLKRSESDTCLSQMLVSSHHNGLPDIVNEEKRSQSNNTFRDSSAQIRKRVDDELDALEKLHEAVSFPLRFEKEQLLSGDPSVFCRMMLSCLADADHSDTARHYGKYPMQEDSPKLRPAERLAKLNDYVKALGNNSERSLLRTEMYLSCRDWPVSEGIAACDSPVGSGKTTAVMAHLLKQAVLRESRRIFVVLPYTNIIRQSVDEYRKALVLDGEDPESVVSELHHLADFESEDVRHLTAQWKAPIVVTTAVAFFETLASCRPAGLRRLHELPGSVIFVDESHAAMPAKLLPIAWHWMEVLSDEWSCYWVLASGSLVRFWELDSISDTVRKVPDILPGSLVKRLASYEQKRIRYCYEPDPLSCDMLVDRVMRSPGPRLVIMNTVRSAAHIAECIRAQYGQGAVMHISTALTAQNRERILNAVHARLKEHPEDTQWVLVATSCVEAGVNLSFRTGFREMASLLSLLQAAGRVNRNGDDENAEIWSFRMQESEYLSANPSLKLSASVLSGFFRCDKEISPALSTLAIEKELELSQGDNPLMEKEKIMNFPSVQEGFHIIESDTVLVTADEEVKNGLRFGNVNWKDIQRKCVCVHREWVKKYRLQPLCEGIYDWTMGYDSFLGIMKGVQNCQRMQNDILMI